MKMRKKKHLKPVQDYEVQLEKTRENIEMHIRFLLGMVNILIDKQKENHHATQV